MRQITPQFFASPQISVEDIPAIAASGIKLILCNRPDEEIPPSHHAHVIEAAAKEAGIAFSIQPLTHQTMVPEVISNNSALMDLSDGPVLAYCASGTRSTIAWALAMREGLSVDEVIAAAAAAGYNIENLRSALEYTAGT